MNLLKNIETTDLLVPGCEGNVRGRDGMPHLVIVSSHSLAEQLNSIDAELETTIRNCPTSFYANRRWRCRNKFWSAIGIEG